MNLTKFQRLKPWFVRRLKQWNTCTFQYHTKFNELRLSLNIMWVARKDIHGQCVCYCKNVCKPELNYVSSEHYCIAHQQPYNTLSSLWTSTFCSKDENIEFHNKGCIMGECNRCGI
jgi:hypothetical protein